MGHYNTHSKMSPMAQGYIADRLRLEGEFNTVEEICKIAELTPIAKEISEKVKKDYTFERVQVVLFDMAGNLKGHYDG